MRRSLVVGIAAIGITVGFVAGRVSGPRPAPVPIPTSVEVWRPTPNMGGTFPVETLRTHLVTQNGDPVYSGDHADGIANTWKIVLIYGESRTAVYAD